MTGRGTPWISDSRTNVSRSAFIRDRCSAGPWVLASLGELVEEALGFGLVLGVARVARGRERDGALELGARLVIMLELLIGAPQLEVMVHIAGLELDRFLE